MAQAVRTMPVHPICQTIGSFSRYPLASIRNPFFCYIARNKNVPNMENLKIITFHQGPRMRVGRSENGAFLRIEMSHGHEEREAFQHDLLLFLELSKPFACARNLWDLRNLEVLIDTDLQDWIDQEVNSRQLLQGTRREAFVMPGDAIAQLAVEQSMDEANGSRIQSAFFGSMPEAEAWLVG